MENKENQVSIPFSQNSKAISGDAEMVEPQPAEPINVPGYAEQFRSKRDAAIVRILLNMGLRVSF